MMRRLCARTKSFTNFSVILVLTGTVCYVIYSSTCIKDGVMQKQTNSKSTQATSPKEAKTKEIIIGHEKNKLLADISKLFDEQNWADEHAEGSTTIQKDLRLQSHDSFSSRGNTIKPTLKSFSPISLQFFPIRKLIQSLVNTKNQRAKQKSIKTFLLKKSSSSKTVSRGNTIAIKPAAKSLSVISKPKASTQKIFPTRKLIQSSVNTKNQRAEENSIKTFPLVKSSSLKTISRGNTVAVEPTAKSLSVISRSRQKAITPTFSPKRNTIQNLVNSKKQKTEQKLIKTFAPSLKNVKLIKNYSTRKLGVLVKPLVKEPTTVETAKQKENVELFIAIFSAPQRLERRTVLRDTWISSIPNYSVAFRFFTDGKELSNETKTKLSEEQNAFGDLEMLPTKGGYWFSHRFLHALFWAHHHYNFSYFLRLDDDYFVCLHHLYHDLQYRKKEKFLYWGWLWCQKEIVRIDEGFVLLGADLAEEIIRRNKSLYCHPFGDQMIEMWFSRLKGEGIKVKYFPDNARVLHQGIRPYDVSQNMCQHLLAIHKSYPDRIRLYWNKTRDVWNSSPRSFKKIAIKDYASYCHIPRGLNWEAISGMYHHEPKPCWKPGVDWPILRSRKMHLGEEAKLKRPKPSEKLKPTTKKYTTGSPARIRI